MASARTISWGWAGIWIGPEGDAVFTGHRPKAPLAKGGCPGGAGGFPLLEVFLITESPVSGLRRCQPPLTRGPLEEDRELQAPKPPLSKGGGPPGETRWRGDSIYRKAVGRDDPGAPFSGGICSLVGGDSVYRKSANKTESPSHRRWRCQPSRSKSRRFAAVDLETRLRAQPLAKGPFPCGGTRGWQAETAGCAPAVSLLCETL